MKRLTDEDESFRAQDENLAPHLAALGAMDESRTHMLVAIKQALERATVTVNLKSVS